MQLSYMRPCPTGNPYYNGPAHRGHRKCVQFRKFGEAWARQFPHDISRRQREAKASDVPTDPTRSSAGAAEAPAPRVAKSKAKERRKAARERAKHAS